jgi:hypothetical protein
MHHAVRESPVLGSLWDRVVDSSSWKEQFEPAKHAKEREQGQADAPERAFARKVKPGST